ncbi:MAG: tetratricopeptide repeat protein [Saprospiraceae bacterium]
MKHLIPHFIQVRQARQENHGHFLAYTMFVDLSGFTRLTETFMKQGGEGAEQLSISLNRIFDPLVNLVYAHGGFVPYFAGDAFTAIFLVEETNFTAQRLLFIAQSMRDSFIEQGLLKTRFGDFQIGIKIGLSYGTVEWGIVGNVHKSFFFRGPAILGSAQAQIHATEQDIILDQNISERYTSLGLSYETVAEGFFKLVSTIATEDYPVLATLDHTDLQNVIPSFLPDAVINFNQGGEFRPVISVFISFKGIQDFEVMNSFATIVLDQINNFSGYFKEIDFGDKGSLMVGFFGAPISFENNTERAIEFIQAIEDQLLQTPEIENLSYRVGLTSGIAYTGMIGGKKRCQFAVVGNWVNIAARLMSSADWGEILVDEAIQKHRAFKFQHQGDIFYKGVEESIPTYKLLGRNTEDKISFSGEMVGRQAEVEALSEFALRNLQAKTGAVAYIYGEAGVGKSRLTYEVKNRLAKTLNLHWLNCQADQILKKPFNPFISFLKNYFEQSPEVSIDTNYNNFELKFQSLLLRCQAAIHRDQAQIIAELLRTKTILVALTGITVENELWEQLDAKGRYQNTLQALSNFFLANALFQPVVLELEDGHWFDDSSKDFLAEFLREVANAPILILVNARYKDDHSKPILFDQRKLQKYKIPKLEVNLKMLDLEALKIFAEKQLNGPIRQDFHELLFRTTNGNPFYAEQIIEFFTESKLLAQTDGEWYIKDKEIKLSSSINSILMARIDRLSTLVKETVKAAAVVGREFEVPVLYEVMKRQNDFKIQNGDTSNILKEQIKHAEKGQIWRAMNEQSYIFKHSLFREAVYGMQLHTRLRELHQLIAESIEKIYSNNLAPKYLDLAFHYEQAEQEEKTKIYLQKAADYAKRNFQNQQALVFYDKLLTDSNFKLSLAKRIALLLKKGDVLELIGQWESCETSYEEALQYATQHKNLLLLGRTNNSLGHLLILKGDYDRAETYLEAAAGYFNKTMDGIGLFKVYGNLGKLFFRQGKYAEAKAYFTRSIQLNNTNQHASFSAEIAANLGLTLMNQGNFKEAIQCQKKQLEVSKAVNDKAGMASLYTNLGIVYFEKGDNKAALTAYQKGLKLSSELGDKLLMSIAIGCIGNVYQRQGDYEKALENFLEDLNICEALGDKQGIAIAIGLIGSLRSEEGKFDIAIEFLQKNLNLCKELGYQKGAAKALKILADIYRQQGLYEISLAHYDQAIHVTRAINNRLVLGFSLIEKANTLVHTKAYAAAAKVQQESSYLIKSINNASLIFEEKILTAKLKAVQESDVVAKDLLVAWLSEHDKPEEQAAIYFTLSQLFPAEKSYQQKALSLYKTLYLQIPRYAFKNRIEQLEQRK